MKTKFPFPSQVISRLNVNNFAKPCFSLLMITILFLMAQCQSNKQITLDTPEHAFHKWAPTPPMGWNSWDCFGPTVVEDEVKANADYMAQHLKKFGWEYIVIDIRWYVENDKADGYNQTDPRYVMDEYGRYQPAVNRFPSAADGKGFKAIADYVHSKGLKFGIHIMRGIPVEAVNKNTPILGSNVKAQDVYSPEGQCGWLRDNYTIDSQKEGAQEYYNSIFALYASWGIDFVKVDDLSGRFPEIEMVRKAIDNTGRPIVLSISPGGSQPENAEFLIKNANMWRTTGDFWDNWPQLKPQFATCERWAQYAGSGHYPDADMLPLGRVGIRAERGDPRWSGFTKDEQYTLMSLFAIFKSPLMFGGDLPSNDEFTLSLITNKDVLYVNQHSINGKQIFRENDLIGWTADDPKTGDKFLALFNAIDQEPIVESKAAYRSEMITSNTPGQSIDIDVDITGAKKLYLVVTRDEGTRSFGRSVFDWIEPKIIGSGKSVNLTDLNWVNATSGRGQPTINKTGQGDNLNVNDKDYKNGISVMPTSIIEYNLPEGYTRFTAKSGIDWSSITQMRTGMQSAAQAGQNVQGGSTRQPSRVSGNFLIFTQDPSGPIPPDVAEISVNFNQLGLAGTHTVTDLWAGKKLGKFTDTFSQPIKRHGAGLYRIH